MKKLKASVVGASGKMGQELARLLKNHPHLSPELGVSRSSSCPGYLRSSNKFEDLVGSDIVIDFSLPASFLTVLETCKRYKLPLVSGVTGLSTQDLSDLREAAKHIPLFWAPNMSLGIATLNKALKCLEQIKDYDFQIEEIHHNQKKDRPSGTAILLQETLKKTVKKSIPEPVSIRGGGVFGIHKVYAMSAEEVIVFEHQALSRGVFASGALRAAEWLISKSPGLYGMEDLV